MRSLVNLNEIGPLIDTACRSENAVGPYPTSLPRVDYALTPLDRSLTERLSRLAAWAGEHRQEIAVALATCDVKASDQ